MTYLLLQGAVTRGKGPIAATGAACAAFIGVGAVFAPAQGGFGPCLALAAFLLGPDSWSATEAMTYAAGYCHER